MRVMFFGSGDFGVPALRWLANSQHNVVAVVTQPDRPAGRGKQLQPTPVAERALLEGFDLVKLDDVNKPNAIATLKEFQADIGVVIDFGQKLLGELRSIFRSECINVHGSLLPKYRGAAPIARAILARRDQDRGDGVQAGRPDGRRADADQTRNHDRPVRNG